MKTYDEELHPRAEDGKYTNKERDEAPGGVSALPVPGDPDPTLIEALEHYGLRLDDIPADCEGFTLIERWGQAVALAEAPDKPTVEGTIRTVLGISDFGRERGEPQLVWLTEQALTAQDPDAEDEYVFEAQDPRWEDDTTTLAAMVYTRNGGGNRDCWCSDGDHEQYGPCTALRVDELVAHPAHLYDVDNSFDSTYASFYFKIDKSNADIRRAVERRTEAVAQRRTREILNLVQRGDVPPWVLMANNPDIAKKLEAMREKMDALRTEASSSLTQHGRRSRPRKPELQAAGSFTEQHAVEADSVLAYVAGGPVPSDRPTKPRNDKTWRPTQRWSTQAELDLTRLVADETKTRELEAKAAQVHSAREALETLPEDIRAVTQAGLDSFGLRNAERDARTWRAKVNERAKDLRAARREIQTHLDAQRQLDELNVQIEEYRTNLGWPGSPGTWPSRLASN